eukprot:scaffold9032_cov21-Tisochrysis_lutea.AAC.2
MTSTAHIPQYQHYWSADPQGPLFGAYHSLLSIFSGFSVCHPIYHKYHDDDDDDDDDNAMAQVLRYAMHSAVFYTDATATFMLLPL